MLWKKLTLDTGQRRKKTIAHAISGEHETRKYVNELKLDFSMHFTNATPEQQNASENEHFNINKRLFAVM